MYVCTELGWRAQIAIRMLDMTVPSYVWMGTSSIGWADGHIEH